MKKLLVIMLGVMVLTSCFAQRANRRAARNATPPAEVAPPVTETAPEQNVITEECLTNMSLFNESARNRQFADALEPWNYVFNNCPGANRVIYSQGRPILHWELSQQKDDASYMKVFEKLMKMYDQRIKYFGNDERYPTAWILGLKALDYVSFAKYDESKITAYGWLEQSIDGLGVNAEMEVLRNFMVISDKIFAADKSHTEKYIQDYLKVNAILETIAADAQNKNAELAAQYKNGFDVLFALSGAANCETLDGMYATQVKQNISNLTYLNRVLSFYRRVKCTESEVYFEAAVAAHKIEPSAESAAALAGMSFVKNEYQQAISFYEEATKLSTVPADQSDYQMKIAQIYYSKLENYPRTKTHAQRALEFKPDNGTAYLLIGMAYAGARGIFNDEILNKTVFWAAVDKFNRAKQVDPSLTEDANKMIATYSRFFPSKEDIFMHPDLGAGKPFFVGGWIGETTICR